MKRPNKQPLAALYTASDSLLMDQCVFSTGNLRGFASPARGPMIVRQGMMFVIRASKVRRPGKPVSRLCFDQARFCFSQARPGFNRARLGFNQGRFPNTFESKNHVIPRIAFFAIQLLNHTTTILSGTTTLMRDFLPRRRGRPAVMGDFTPKGCVQPKYPKIPSGGFFAAQQPPCKPRCATSVNRDHCGAGSDVTNLCKDEIYLLGPNTVGLFVVARC